MYMFYLLRFRIVRLCQETVRVANEQNRLSELANCGKGDACRQAGRSHLHRAFDEQVLKKVSPTHYENTPIQTYWKKYNPKK